jgi:hypothetical protein
VTVDKKIIETIFKFDRLDVLKQGPTVSNFFSKFYEDYRCDWGRKIASFGALNILKFIVPLERKNIYLDIYHYWLAGFLDGRKNRSGQKIDGQKVDGQKIESFFEEFVFSYFDNLKGKNYEKVKMFQNFIYCNNFSSLRLFIFFFKKVIDLISSLPGDFVYNNPHIFIDKPHLVSNQEDKRIVKWLVENKYVDAGSMLELGDGLSKDENIETLLYLLGVAGECKFYGSIETFFKDNKDKILRCYIWQKSIFDKMFLPSTLARSLDSAKTLVSGLEDQLSEYFPSPLVHIILMAF